jgi:hypothetical protein
MGSEFFQLRLLLAAVAVALVTTHSVTGRPTSDESAGGTVAAHNFLGSRIEQTVDFLRSQDPETSGTFFVACKITPPHDAPSENYTLLIPISAHSAYLVVTIENEGKLVTANMATLSLLNKAVSVQEAMGGVWTYQRLRGITNHLLTRDFRFTFDYAVPFDKQPTEACAASE